MAQRFDAEFPPHVAQQSRRDKLRVQAHQLGHYLNPNSNPSSSDMMLDFAAEGSVPLSCDWIVNCVGESGVNNGNVNHCSYGEYGVHFPMSLPYQHTLQEVVAPSTSSAANHGMEMMSSFPPQPPTPWLDPGQHQLQLQQAHKGLSLSLASNPAPQLHADAGFACPGPPSDPRKLMAAPLGPFTGYATILKSSRFLRPAQQLLDEFCSAVAPDCDYLSAAACGSGSNLMGESGVSSSSLFGSMEGGSSDGGMFGGGSNCDQVRRPEIQQKKVKLIYLQEEVCRRYKQYHQQMQMVVSSFETVAGISAATPYTSLAVKSVSKHFRCLKNAISDQLRQVSKLLGEELMSSPSSSSRGDTMMAPRLKYLDQSLRKHNRGSENSGLGFLDNNQPVWRPQRGLPERAVAVLRAWLFEHFLHPYPTDTDKHMLATQTGLSRNQVSNWFINARVRLWKPMVEEIHNLESKGMADMNLNSNKNNGKSIMDDDGGHPYPDHYLSESQPNKPLDCSSMGHLANDTDAIGAEPWHRGEKRTRMEECTIPQSMDGGLMSFAYQGGMDLGGLGAVSLTLGLRHSEDPQQQQQQMRHFGSQMLHDFVG